FASTRPLAGLVRRVVNLARIGAVDDNARNAVSDGSLGKVLHAKLHVRRRGVSPKIVFDDQHDTEFLHGSKVQALVCNARRLAAIANVSESGNVAPLQSRTETYAAHNADQLAQHRNRRRDI